MLPAAPLCRTAAWVACLSLGACQSAPPPAVHTPHHAAIRQVVSDFQSALLQKDKARYLGLFFSDQAGEVGWQHVSEDRRLAHIRLAQPGAIKARRLPGNHFRALIDEAVGTPEPREERFSDAKIDTDGDVAAVSFDYAFLANGQPTNWGRELWQLVRTESGWKIFSVVYSIRDERSGDAAPPPGLRPAP